MAGKLIHFEETELRLGLPGGGGGGGGGCKNDLGKAINGNGKRGFDETTVDLKLNLLSSSDDDQHKAADPDAHNLPVQKNLIGSSPANPPTKAQVVGWPPVRSFRKNILAVKKSSNSSSSSNEESEKLQGSGGLVKVSMDGAPYLRKVDLKMYKSYQDLSDALGNMFSSFTIGNCGSQGMKDFMNERKLMDLLNSWDYVPTYEDKDGDWMLVGDVPWEMFVNSCKRLRIMKGAEAIGLAPRAMEKCKNRS
ncbi:hypothetical protein LguiA_011563 [Lonicera macranthoides]